MAQMSLKLLPHGSGHGELDGGGHAGTPQRPVRRACSRCAPLLDNPHSDYVHRLHFSDVLRMVLTAVAIGATWFGVWAQIPYGNVLSLLLTLLCGYPVFAQAYKDVVARRMTMELSMTIALVTALAVGELITTLIIIFFVLVAEQIELMMVWRGRLELKHLTDQLPRTAMVRRPGSREAAEIEVSKIEPGDIIVVKPGENIPVDGEVVAGGSSVDQKAISGESMPVEKAAGDRVFAGTVNQFGVLEIRAEKVGPDTQFGKIVATVEEAERARAPVQRLADRLAGLLVYFAVACALATFAFTLDLRAAVSVIIVVGACGVAAGTPLAILGAIGRAARNGCLVKGGLPLEQLAEVNVVVMDKTGTLTKGQPQVVACNALPGVTVEELVRVAAVAESSSEHPLARAIVLRATEMSLVLTETGKFDYRPGKGVVSTFDGEQIAVGSRSLMTDVGVLVPPEMVAPSGLSEVLVSRGGRLLGSLHLRDALRAEAGEAISCLKTMGIKTVMLTGDSDSVASLVGRDLKMDEVGSELLPQEKLERIQELKREGNIVAMVGDGVNDAPALTEADVGVALQSGTDVAIECASVVVIGSNLLKLVETIRTARQCRDIILANFVLTILIDALGIGLAAFGLIGPLLAALVHVGSELLVLLNSARLLVGARTRSCSSHRMSPTRQVASHP